MAYASTEDVTSRAAALAAAWDGTVPGNPDETDLQLFLDQVSGEIDVLFAAHGVSTPLTDVKARAALRPLNADMALLLALDSTWPGSSARDDVADLRTSVQERIGAYFDPQQSTPQAATINALVTMLQGEDAGQSGGASDFWSSEGPGYLQTEWWSRWSSWWTNSWPAFMKGGRF